MVREDRNQGAAVGSGQWAVSSGQQAVHRILRISSFPPRLRVPVCRQAWLRRRVDVDWNSLASVFQNWFVETRTKAQKNVSILNSSLLKNALSHI